MTIQNKEILIIETNPEIEKRKKILTQQKNLEFTLSYLQAIFI